MRIQLRDEIFGEMLPYIRDDDVTDVNWNGSALWINSLTRGRYMDESVKLDDHFVEQFSNRIANLVNQNFNMSSPLLEAETDSLRVSIIHDEVAATGKSISIRKTPAVRRLNREKMEATGYSSSYINDFLEECIKAKMNIVICGLPGVGKTELLKTLTEYIPANERVITIEDNLEIRYAKINPGKDCVELKVDQDFTYTKAIKACLRQLPEWILLSEARSVEVKFLLESMSTGTHCLTTLHTDDVRKIPDRIKNMMPTINEQTENDIYSFINVGIQVRSYIMDEGIQRKIAQIALFSRDLMTWISSVFRRADTVRREKIEKDEKQCLKEKRGQERRTEQEPDRTAPPAERDRQKARDSTEGKEAEIQTGKEDEKEAQLQPAGPHKRDTRLWI